MVRRIPCFNPLDMNKNFRQKMDMPTEGSTFYIQAIIIQIKIKYYRLFYLKKIKNWQKSNIKLLVAGTISSQKNGSIKKLDSYKYKEDVVLLDGINNQQLALITASAYAVIHPFFYEPLIMPVLSSMQCGVPVIVISPENIDEMVTDTCLYVSPYDTEGLANQLKLLYRDESLSRSLVEKGLKATTDFNWERTGGLFWNVILKANS